MLQADCKCVKKFAMLQLASICLATVKIKGAGIAPGSVKNNSGSTHYGAFGAVNCNW